MSASKPGKHFPRRLRASGLHLSQPTLDALNRLYALEQLLVGPRILDHDL
jgi:hypothetical protein